MTWSESVEAYLKQHAASTAAMYARGLVRFRHWYVDRYEEEPDPALLTDEELRQWQHHLYEERKLAASTVNWHLSADAAWLIVQHQGINEMLDVVTTQRMIRAADDSRRHDRVAIARILGNDRLYCHRIPCVVAELSSALPGARISVVIPVGVRRCEWSHQSFTSQG